jgi:hypothetical protein
VARGGHGLPKLLLGPAMPYPIMPCGRPPLKQSYCHLGGGHLPPPWTPHAIRLRSRPVREGVSTDSLKFYAGPPCPTLIRPAAVFFPLGYPTPYGPGLRSFSLGASRPKLIFINDYFFYSPKMSAVSSYFFLLFLCSEALIIFSSQFLTSN